MSEHFFLVPVNYFAILICAVVSMLLGYLWYGPLFGKKWENLVGLTAEKKKKAKKTMPQKYLIMFISSLVMAYILFHFIWYAAPGSVTLFKSLKVAIYSWLGFIATFSLSKFLFSTENQVKSLLFIETGFYLVDLILISVIIFMFLQ